MNRAVFFITTPRSGTQWLAAGLDRHYQDCLIVAHEPIEYAYAPKAHLRADEHLDRLRWQPAVAAHLEYVHHVLQTKSYVEVGFPCFAAAPLLRREFGDRLRLVQLIRHPVRVAASMVTHRWYQQLREDTEKDMEITPADSGALLKHYADDWTSMSPFEKALFYWTEVHLFACEAHARFSDVPFLCTRLEDLVCDVSAQEALAAFVGVPLRKCWADFVDTRIDQHHLRTRKRIDPGEARGYPETVALARRHGYELNDVDGRAIRSRYEFPRAPLLNRVRSRVRRLAVEPLARAYRGGS